MTNSDFDYYLKEVVSCPELENSKPQSICKEVIVQKWATLLGWGNPNSKIVFIGINPFYNLEAHQWHTPTNGKSPFEHVKYLSKIGANHARHFSYHRRILRDLRTLGNDLVSYLPDRLEDFAFYTEVAFCPSINERGLDRGITKYCFEKNVKPFILNSGFQVVIALGDTPTRLCVSSFIGEAVAESLGSCHGKSFKLPGKDKYLITSYHPSYRAKWDRSFVAKTIADLVEKGKINLFKNS